MVEGVLFPLQIFTPKALSLVAHGFFDKPEKTVMGVYLDPSDVKPHFENWKIKHRDVLVCDNLSDALLLAKMDKVIRVVVMEGTYDLYGPDLETEVKGKLEGCTEAEQTEIDKIVQFIRSKHINAITYHFPAKKDTPCKIGIEIEGKEGEEYLLTVENESVVGALLLFSISGVYRLSPCFDDYPQIMVKGVPFPSVIFFPPEAFLLVAQGFANQPTNTVIGLYLDSLLVKHHFKNWKLKTRNVLSGDHNIFHTLFSAEMDKVITVVVTKEIKGGHYGIHLKEQMSRLMTLKKTEVDKVVSFFDSKDLKTNSIITYYFSHENRTCEITTKIEGIVEEDKLMVENANVVGALHSLSLCGINKLLPGFDN